MHQKAQLIPLAYDCRRRSTLAWPGASTPPTARLVLLAYIVAAVAVSVLAMRSVELDSRIVVATMVGTLAATAAYGRRFAAMAR